MHVIVQSVFFPLHMVFLVRHTFTTGGRIGRSGVIQTLNISATGCYFIEAYGGAGGTSNFSGKLWPGGRGAKVLTRERIPKDTILTVIVGQKAGPLYGVRKKRHFHTVTTQYIKKYFQKKRALKVQSCAHAF